MGLLDFLFRKKETQPQRTEELHPACPHLVFAPRWDNVQDIGKEEKAVGYRCVACNADFSVDEGKEILRQHSLAPQ